VFVAGSRGELIAINADSGAELWRETATTKDIGHGYSNVIGPFHSSPVVHDGVVVGAGHEVLACKASDGTVLWRKPCRRPVYGSPTILPGEPPRVAVAGTLLALHTGDELGALKAGQFGTPAAEDQYVANFGGTLRAFRAGDAFTLEGESGKFHGRDSGAGCAILSEGRAYAFGAALPQVPKPSSAEGKQKPKAEACWVCLDVNTGQIVWEHRDAGRRFSHHNSPILVDGKIVVLMRDTAAVVDAATGQFLQEDIPTKHLKCTSAAYADGRLFVRGYGSIRSLRLSR
jgi:outer membrane protein assembly factor BamB